MEKVVACIGVQRLYKSMIGSIKARKDALASYKDVIKTASKKLHMLKKVRSHLCRIGCETSFIDNEIRLTKAIVVSNENAIKTCIETRNQQLETVKQFEEVFNFSE